MKQELKGVVENTAIHCSTLESALQVLKIAEERGYKWFNGAKYSEIHNWNEYKSNTCYSLTEGLYADLSYHMELGYFILSDEDFLMLNSFSDLEDLTTRLDKLLHSL